MNQLTNALPKNLFQIEIDVVPSFPINAQINHLSLGGFLALGIQNSRDFEIYHGSKHLEKLRRTRRGTKKGTKSLEFNRIKQIRNSAKCLKNKKLRTIFTLFGV
ncbi:hypothetical protein P872_06780 [Rhodonellum psychrophilum GCM71 = DSM 17998]|uniref:Uncharacterized protein n=1 Tax=Rhodonellum psychrophilum GCM71 = DSM 17998 TaxID=1123057 RepID=U5BZ60_9BACT|nr:hypothetical protein P872_06780 [Rhodonellum psychrophilum GCM71 = DSM 17998]